MESFNLLVFKVPQCELCLCNHMSATFRLMAQPECLRRGDRNRKGNRVSSERGRLDEVFQTLWTCVNSSFHLLFKLLPPSREICYLLSHFKSHQMGMREGRGGGGREFLCVCL